MSTFTKALKQDSLQHRPITPLTEGWYSPVDLFLRRYHSQSLPMASHANHHCHGTQDNNLKEQLNRYQRTSPLASSVLNAAGMWSLVGAPDSFSGVQGAEQKRRFFKLFQSAAGQLFKDRNVLGEYTNRSSIYVANLRGVTLLNTVLHETIHALNKITKHNGGAPYRQGDVVTEQQWKIMAPRFLEEIKGKDFIGKAYLDYDSYDESDFSAELSARIMTYDILFGIDNLPVSVELRQFLNSSVKDFQHSVDRLAEDLHARSGLQVMRDGTRDEIYLTAKQATQLQQKTSILEQSLSQALAENNQALFSDLVAAYGLPHIWLTMTRAKISPNAFFIKQLCEQKHYNISQIRGYMDVELSAEEVQAFAVDVKFFTNPSASTELALYLAFITNNKALLNEMIEQEPNVVSQWLSENQPALATLFKAQRNLSSTDLLAQASVITQPAKPEPVTMAALVSQKSTLAPLAWMSQSVTASMLEDNKPESVACRT